MNSNLRALDLNLLPIFNALMQEQNLTRASESLALSQSATSHALKRLRATFKDDLFVRTSRGLTPTHRAKEIHNSIKPALHMIQEGCLMPNFMPSESRLTLNVSMNAATEYLMAADIISAFRQQAPGMSLRLFSDHGEDLKVRLKNGSLDYAIDFLPFDDSQFNEHIVAREHLCVISAIDHPIVKDRLTLDDFERQPHVSLVPRSGQYHMQIHNGSTPIQQLVGDALPKRNLAMFVSNYASMPDIVANTDLLAVVPERMARHPKYVNEIQCFEMPFTCPTVDVRLIWHKSRDAEASHQWFFDCIKNLI